MRADDGGVCYASAVWGGGSALCANEQKERAVAAAATIAGAATFARIVHRARRASYAWCECEVLLLLLKVSILAGCGAFLVAQNSLPS